MSLPGTAEALLEKLRDLPAGKLAEVEDFVDFLRERERRAAVSHAKRLQTAAESGQITPVTPGLERSFGERRAARRHSGETTFRDGARGPAAIVFFDTSALVKRYVIEADSPVVLALWTNASTLAVSQILYAEMAATFARKRREVLQRPVRRELPPSALLDHAEQTFLSDWASLRRIAVDDDVNRRVHGFSRDIHSVAPIRFISPPLCCSGMPWAVT